VSKPSTQTFGGIDVCQTAYNHPDITSGQHTNGPVSIWARVPGGEWVPTGTRKLNEVRFWCEGFGVDYVKHLAEGEQ
jgi:hypothetical protein